jgi:hypothetical protein
MDYIIYRITAVLKVEVDIIARTSCDNVFWDLQNWHYCCCRWSKIVFDFKLTDNFQYQNQFLHMWVTNSHNIFVDQGQFSNPDFISGTHQRENVQFANKYIYQYQFTIAYIEKKHNWMCNNAIMLTFFNQKLII